MENDLRQESERREVERRECVGYLGRNLKDLKEVEDEIGKLEKTLLAIDIEAAEHKMSPDQIIKTKKETEERLAVLKGQQKELKSSIEFLKDVLNEKW